MPIFNNNKLYTLTAAVKILHSTVTAQSTLYYLIKITTKTEGARRPAGILVGGDFFWQGANRPPPPSSASPGAHTLGPILIRNEPKCSKLNCRQFEYFLSKYNQLCRANFSKAGADGGKPSPLPSTEFFFTVNVVGQPISYKNIQKL